MAVYFPHLTALLHSGMKDAARCVDDLCCDVTEEECHVTLSRGASQEVSPSSLITISPVYTSGKIGIELNNLLISVNVILRHEYLTCFNDFQRKRSYLGILLVFLFVDKGSLQK